MSLPFREHVERDAYALTRLASSDVDDLFEHFSDSRVVEFLDFAPLRDRAEAEEIVAWASDLFERDKGIRWTIRVSGSGRFVGTCGFNEIVTSHGSRGSIAYDLAPEFWGRGVMGCIMPYLIETGFRDLGLHRLEAFVTPGNTRSARVLERHGFRHEGRLRGYGHWRDAFWDQDIYGMTSVDWGRG